MYKNAMDLGSLSAAIFERIARTHKAMHHYRRAVAEYAKASRLRPDDSSLRLAKIDLFITIGDLQRASVEVEACELLLQVCYLSTVETAHDFLQFLLTIYAVVASL
jgi:predicted TPR repeat methyltransferase